MMSRGSGARVSKVVRHVFGPAGMHPGQQAEIDTVLANTTPSRSCPPAGAGKSLCHQVRAMLIPGMAA